MLEAVPTETVCHTRARGTTACTILLKTDFEALVRELKAACLANGQPVPECQAER